MSQDMGCEARRWRRLAAAAVTVGLLLAGCAGHQPAGAVVGSGPPQLRSRFDAPRYLADPRAVDPPASLIHTLPHTATAATARMSVDEVVAEFMQRGLPGRYAAAEAPTEADAESAAEESSSGSDAAASPLNADMTRTDLEAMKRYAAARQALLQGEFADAERLVEALLESDPHSSPGWKLRADLARLQGQPAAFLAACERLLEVDPQSVYALTHLGRRLTSLGEDSDAVRLLARARLFALRGEHRIPAPLIDADLATSLQRLGYARAAAEVYSDMLDGLVEALPQNPYYRGELRYLYEQQSGYLRLLGDAWMTAGEPTAALRAYTSAARLAELPGGFLLARRVWAGIAAGRPAAAANAMFEDLARHPEHAPSAQDLTLARYLRETTRLQRQARSAIDLLLQRHPHSARLALVRATWVESEARAAARVREQLRRQPDAPTWTRSALLVPGERAVRLALAADLLAMHPHESPRIWRALRDADKEPDQLHADLMRLATQQPTAAHCVLAAQAQMQRGEWTAARRTLERCRERSAVLAFARAQILAEQLRFPEALLVLDRLDKGGADPLAIARTRIAVWRDMQFIREALRESERLESSAGELTAADYVQRAALHAALREPERQAAALRRAIELDPDADAAHGELIRLLDRTGELSDSEAYTHAVQALHARNPNSSELRLLRAEEQVRRQEFAAAEAQLAALVREEPDNAAALDLLVDIWGTLRSFESGLALLEELRAQHPHEANVVRGVARLHMHRASAEAALATLDAFLADHPHAHELQDLYESALYQAGRTAEALDRIVARLAVLEPAHRTPEMTLALAMSQIGQDEVAATLDALSHLDQRVILTREQCTKARHILLSIIRSRQRQAEANDVWSVSDAEAKLAYQLDQSALWQRAEIRECALALAWFHLLTVLDQDDAPQAIALLERYRLQQRLGAMLAAVSDEFTDAGLEEALYYISNWPTLSDASREIILERLLELEPDHAMALNNLGYTWLEAGVRLSESIAYLERAYALMPTDHNIIDSLGWARYKQGIYEDEVGPDGTLLRRGAVSLLEEALAQTPQGVEPIVLDHLGDSLWRAGRYDDAKERWQRALEQLPATPSVTWQTELRERLTAKLEALEQGEEPPVAGSPGLPTAPGAAVIE